MKLPQPRGPVSSALFDLLASAAPSRLAAVHEVLAGALPAVGDILTDEDLQLALFCLYELHYSGLEDTDERWEWDPDLIGFRARIEAGFEAALRAVAEPPPAPEADAQAVARTLFDLAAADAGPSVSRYIARQAGLEQLREFLIHKSVYQLREADPHTWAIPRLAGRPKAALVEIQADEYGGGRPERMHSALFARTMRGLGLCDTYGAYVDEVPALTLASVNMMSLFGLHRRLRGAIVGHLAIYEMTSSIPNSRYSRGFRRHGFDAQVTGYFDEHVEADAVHEQIAGRDLAGALVEAEPALLDSVLFGAAAAVAVDALLGSRQLAAWQAGTTSLRAPLSAGA